MSLERFNLKGKLVLVTGSSQGIGYAMAEGLGQAGARLVLNGRDKAKLETARKDMAAKGLDVVAAAFDVTEESEVNAAIADIGKNHGAIDILINNAGMQFRTPLEDFPADKFRELLRVNIESAFLVGKAVAKGMIARKAGKIINICSVQSELGRPSIAPYTATKGAIKMLTKGMCADWAKHGIQVNAIGPGYFKTPLNQALVDNPEFSSWLEKRTPAGRWGDVEELIGAAIFLASPASSFVNGHILYVDGGITSVL
ncbi:SDR family oxidoreductase [Aestuariivirga litoralis]|uniref:SDR family oxidoreductase n=1 Tax=Aestuariivirga litoralis TaxID=2650924 RepID=UPI0018C6253A|nr:SDR family oxidoreductase [Aestuariivirga litoralis]MBG1233284.1 SDR family oxidoreductase [Aestuariivirga litoralis]